MSTILSLAPQNVWKNFYSLTQVPRPSGYLKKVQEFLGRMFLSVMIRVSSYDYVHEKRAAVCIPQPSKQGFSLRS